MEPSRSKEAAASSGNEKKSDEPGWVSFATEFPFQDVEAERVAAQGSTTKAKKRSAFGAEEFPPDQNVAVPFTTDPASYTIMSDTYGPLWTVLDVKDERVIHDMTRVLRKLGVNSLADLSFLSHRSVVKEGWPDTVTPVVARKFKAICKYYWLGNTIHENTTMADIISVVNKKDSSSSLSVRVQQSSVQQAQLSQQRAIPVPKRPPPPPAPVVPTKPRQFLNVVIVDDCQPGTPGWHHLNQFRTKKSFPDCNIPTVVCPPTGNESFYDFCRQEHIKVYSSLKTLPQMTDNGGPPTLFVLGASRLKDLFALLERHTPAAILIDLPGTIKAKSLQTMEESAREKRVPLYLNVGRAIAPYVSGTLEMASSSGLEPKVTWYCKEHNSKGAELEEAMAKGRILTTTALAEMVIAVMYFGVKVESLCAFRINVGLTERMTGTSRSRDFVKAALQMTTESGVELAIIADRSSSVDAYLGCVGDEQGHVLRQFDHEQKDSDLLLKKRIVKSLEHDTVEVLPTIRMGVEAVRLAEFADRQLHEAIDDLIAEENKGLMSRLVAGISKTRIGSIGSRVLGKEQP